MRANEQTATHTPSHEFDAVGEEQPHQEHFVTNVKQAK